MMKLTVAQEDYLEVIHTLAPDGGGVRTTDIAAWLDCRLPTVTRTIRRMAGLGLVEHESRGLISLTRKGQSAARALAHRHADSVAFLTDILGLSPQQAEDDACQIEHGLSPLAAQRLHEFLEYFNRLDDSKRAIITEFARHASTTPADFRNLPSGKTAGWRV